MNRPSPFREPDRAQSTRRRLLAVAFGLLIAAAVCQFWPAASFWRQSRLAQGLGEYAERSPDGAAGLTVRRLAECGLAGVDSLVRLAGSRHVAAAAAAREAVLNELAEWEMESRVAGDDGLFARRLRLLAEALRRQVGEFDSAGRRWAGAVAQQIVSQSGDLAADQAAELLRSCDTVLAAMPAARRQVDLTIPEPMPAGAGELADSSRRLTAPADAPQPQRSADTPLPPAEPLRVVRTTPTGDINIMPAEPLPPAAADGDQDTPSTPAPQAQTPREILPWPTERDANPLRTPAIAPAPSIADVQPLAAPPQSDAVIDVPSPQQSRYMLRRYRRLSDGQLAELVDAGSLYESLAVKQVLRERGLSQQRQTAGRPAAVTDASRERLLETLSKLPPAEGRAMLRRLVVDADPEMRLEALTILATTDDPQLAAIVRRRAVEDADPRVTELATRILKERK